MPSLGKGIVLYYIEATNSLYQSAAGNLNDANSASGTALACRRARRRAMPTTETCTMRLHGLVCGKRLEPDEYRKYVRCSACRSLGAAAKRVSDKNIAEGRGKRKHAAKKVRVRAGDRAKVRSVNSHAHRADYNSCIESSHQYCHTLARIRFG